jgi:hypothetical protein
MPAFDPITARSQAVPDLHYLDGGPPYRAGLDRLQLPYVSGWALDLREPGREVHVAIQVDGLTLGRCEAREERDDIAHFVPGVRPGFVMRLTGGASEDVAAVVARLMGFDDARLAAPAPVTLRLDDEATFHGGDGFDLSAAELLALLLHAPSPGLAAALEVEPDAPAGPVAMLAGISTELLLFDEAAYLRANPKARDEGRSELGAAFRHWVESGGEADGFEHDDRTPVTPETECLLLAELALAEGRPGAARHWLRAALNRLLGPQPQDFAEAVGQVLEALEVSGEAAGPRRGAAPLMARMAYAGALALGPAAAGRLLPRLAAANLALHPARRSSSSRDTDLHWWARLAALVLRGEPKPENMRDLCLEAWRQVSPEQRRRADTPVPPTARMRRLLLLCWSASTHGQGGAGDAEEALAAALALSRELVGVREQPWRGVLRGALREAYARGRPDAATLAAILCAGFEAGFGPSRLGACGVLLRTLGLETAGMARLSPPDEAVRRGRFDVGFLVGMREGESYRYRVLNIADALEDAGLAVTTLLPGEHEALLERCTELGRLVVFRAALNAPVRAMMEAANRLGATVSYDVDDLVFDPSLAPQIKALDLVPPEERAYTIGWMRRYREAMLVCDAGTVSTEQLRARMAAMGLPASVVPNTHGPFERAIAGRARREPDQPLTVAYFSGTWTHHADFEQCDAALRAVLRRPPEVRFLLAGNLRLGRHGPGWRRRWSALPFCRTR